MENSDPDASSDEEFVDALEVPVLPDQISVELSISEAKIALDFFLNNRFNEAKERMEPYAGKSMYHALANGTIYYLEAASTFQQEHFNQATHFIKAARDVCSKFRSKSLGMFSSFTAKTPYDEIEGHAELGYAESLLELAFVNLMRDERMVTLLQSSLKIRECYQCYKHCLDQIERIQWKSSMLRQEFECGVYFGLGAFNLMISLLPQRALRLLEFVGFSGDKHYGLSLLKKASAMTSCLRSPLCGLMLLMYHNYVTHMLNMDSDTDRIESELLLKIWLDKYQNSALFLFFAGRSKMISLNLPKAMNLFTESIASQSQWINYHHLCYWELMWCHAVQCQWGEAMQYAEKLACQSRWSQVIYRYLKAVFILQLIQERMQLMLPQSSEQSYSQRHLRALQDEASELLRELPNMMRRIAGKSLPMEKFAVKKAARYFTNGEYLPLPAFEMIFVWNGFKLIRNNQPVLDRIFRTAELSIEFTEKNSKSADDLCLARVILGSCLASQGNFIEAESHLIGIVEEFDKQNLLQFDTYLVPYALVELVQICVTTKRIDFAENLLEKAYNFKKYNLENRLHFKMHALRSRIDEIVNNGTSSPLDGNISTSMAEKMQLDDDDEEDNEEGESDEEDDSPDRSAFQDVRVEPGNAIAGKASSSKKTRITHALRNPRKIFKNLKKNSTSPSSSAPAEVKVDMLRLS